MSHLDISGTYAATTYSNSFTDYSTIPENIDNTYNTATKENFEYTDNTTTSNNIKNTSNTTTTENITNAFNTRTNKTESMYIPANKDEIIKLIQGCEKICCAVPTTPPSNTYFVATTRIQKFAKLEEKSHFFSTNFHRKSTK